MAKECLNCKESYLDEIKQCPKCDFTYNSASTEEEKIVAQKLLEQAKEYICPSCKKIALEDYIHTLSTFQQMRQGASARTSAKNAVRGGISMAKHFFTMFTSEFRKDMPQLICTKCNKFAVNCPYCKRVNPMSGKIPHEFYPINCIECKNEFDVFIFNA